MRTLYDSLEFLSTLDKEHPMYDGILTTVLKLLEQSLQDAPQKQNDFQRLVDGVNLITDGVTQVDDGLGELLDGSGQLVEG